jgi:hypothetical protein
MFEPPVDAWYAWLGVGGVSLAVFGVVLGLPTVAPPDAVAVAETVDAVASSPHEARASRELRADRIRLGAHRVALRTESGTSHASFAYGPVTPTWESARLTELLNGRDPATVFASPAAFRETVQRVRTRRPGWRDAPAELIVRRVSWEGVDVTLVGA